MDEEKAAFIRANTAVMAPPHVPEIRLHLADEAHGLWHRTEEELQEIGVEPPFWAFAWAGGQAVARYILDNPDMVRGKTVVDFASGSGLVAIAAMKAGAKSVLASDIDTFCAAAVALNAEANEVAVTFTSDDLLLSSPPSADVIAAGDICYEKPLADRALAWLGQARDAGALVLLGDPGRTYFPKDRLQQLAEYQVPTTRELEDLEVKKTGVWRFPEGSQ